MPSAPAPLTCSKVNVPLMLWPKAVIPPLTDTRRYGPASSCRRVVVVDVSWNVVSIAALVLLNASETTRLSIANWSERMPTSWNVAAIWPASPAGVTRKSAVWPGVCETERPAPDEPRKIETLLALSLMMRWPAEFVADSK